jgi:phage host-nuclease inhibitor protein Gam
MARKTKAVVKHIKETQFQESITQYAVADATKSKLEAQMEAEVARIREKYIGKIEPLAASCEQHFEVIQTFCEENKARLFGKRRAIEMHFGTVGFRLGTPKLKLLPKMKWDAVLDNLKQHLPKYVRTITEPAKDKLLADRESEEVAPILQKVGLQVGQDERFFIELKKELA